jgi:hypothetical protein
MKLFFLPHSESTDQQMLCNTKVSSFDRAFKQNVRELTEFTVELRNEAQSTRPVAIG